jgi:hypothetical protein
LKQRCFQAPAPTLQQIGVHIGIVWCGTNKSSVSR